MKKLLEALKSLGSLKTAGTAIGLTAAGAVLTQITNQGIDATPLVVLPPLVKLGISVAAPVIAAYLKRSPRETNEAKASKSENDYYGSE